MGETRLAIWAGYTFHRWFPRRTSIDDVITPVDIHHLASDELCAVEREKRRRRAHVVYTDQAPGRRLALGLVQEFVEFRNAGRGAGRERAGRDRMDTYALRTDLGGDVANGGFERGLR